jgi:hypothetical protein
MIRGVSESFVDLAYRGLSLGRRIRLAQIRPSTGYLELPQPMPVGAQIAITTGDGAAFEATVIGVHEQISGVERTPGMIVAPALTGDDARAWWASRVALPDDDAVRRRPITAGGRSRPPTVRPRSHTDPPPGRPEPRTIVTPAAELEALLSQSSDADPATTLTMSRAPSHDGDDAHGVVDDGNRTMIMESLDPAALGQAAAPPANEFGDGDAGDVTDPGGLGSDEADDADAGDEPDGDAAGAAGDPLGDTAKDPPTAEGGGRRRRRRSRR